MPNFYLVLNFIFVLVKCASKVLNYKSKLLITKLIDILLNVCIECKSWNNWTVEQL